MRTEISLRFPGQTLETDAYRLLELPPELLKIIEGRVFDNTKPEFVLKGNATDDAVLCTNSRTYAVRAVTLSNAFLVATPVQRGECPDATSGHTMLVREQVSQILELVPTIPRLERFEGMLKDSEYDEEEEDDLYEATPEEEIERAKKGRRYTYEDVASVVQASDDELHRALDDRHVLRLDNHLRPIAPAYLTRILTLVLTTLISHSLPYQSASIEIICNDLQSLHDVRQDVTKQVLGWYGEIDRGNHKWAINPQAVVKEIGLGILRVYVHEPIDKAEFLEQWKTAVGDSFEEYVDLQVLKGNYIHDSTTNQSTALTYFPSSALSHDPATRFGDLFLTRLRWRHEDIIAFLSEISVDAKDRDRLLIKFARSLTDKDGAVWYTTRTTHI